MWFSAFRGGVHPDGFKELSSHKPIRSLPLPPQLRVPLRQHAGSESVPVVKAGERVLKGQLIARCGQGVSAPVHAPTSGIVEDIKPVVAAHPSGCASKAIIINSDGLDEACYQPPQIDCFQLSAEELSQRISDAGIVGMGGAAFPAAVKLKAASGRGGVETLLINGGECEPYLTADDALMRERAADIVIGARLIQKVVAAGHVAVVIEDNKGEAIDSMREAIREWPDMEVKVVPTRYPMGSAKQMIQAVTGREVPAGGRSSDVGVLMHNVATAYAIAMALTRSEPLISRIVTVSGSAVQEPQNVEALIGTPIEFLIEHCGGLTEQPERILLGGPMMGHIMPGLEVPLIKGAAGVLALRNREINKPAESPCIRCGRCVDACPMGLVPLEMANHSRHLDFEGANEYGLKDCILCGSCAYVCPSHIPLVHYFQFAKGELSLQKASESRSQHTRALADAKRLRKEREAAEKAAAKAAAKAARAKKKPRTTAAQKETAE